MKIKKYKDKNMMYISFACKKYIHRIGLFFNYKKFGFFEVINFRKSHNGKVFQIRFFILTYANVLNSGCNER